MRTGTEKVRRWCIEHLDVFFGLFLIGGIIGTIGSTVLVSEMPGTEWPIELLTFFGLAVLTGVSTVLTGKAADRQDKLSEQMRYRSFSAIGSSQYEKMWLVREAFRTRSMAAKGKTSPHFAAVVIDGGSSDTHVMLLRRDGQLISVVHDRPFKVTRNLDPDVVLPARLCWNEFREEAEKLEREAFEQYLLRTNKNDHERLLSREDKLAQQEFRKLITSN